MIPFDHSGNFRPVVQAAELRVLAIRGAGATIFSQGLSFAIHIVSTIILARLLTPADFGLVTMVTTFSLLFVNVGLNGFTEAILQRPQIDRFLVSNLFWINAAVGLILTLVFAAGGALLAAFYGEPRLGRVSVLIAFSIILTSLSVQHLALLKRAMLFTEASAVDVLGRTVGAVVSIFLAWQGWGYWALVAGIVVPPLSIAVGAAVLCRWIPSAPRKCPGTIEMVRFAMHTYGRFTLNYFVRNVDNLMVGWKFGAQPLGFYKKAYDLFLLPTSQVANPLTNVAVSALSKMTGNVDEFKRHLVRAQSTMAFLGMGLGAGLMLIAEDLIFALLGPGWAESGRIFMFFGPGIGIMLLYSTHAWIHLSIGRADRWFRWAVVEAVGTGLCFAVGLRWGPVGMAVAWVASLWILTLPSLSYAGRPIHLGVSETVAAVWRYVIASALAWMASAWLVSWAHPGGQLTGLIGALDRMAMVGVLFSILYLGCVTLLHGGWDPIRGVADLLREMIPKRATAQ
jgi:PST family polysaccharide transporter